MEIKTTKADILTALDQLPETATLLDAIETLYFMDPELGLSDLANKGTISQEEIVRRVEQWLHQSHEAGRDRQRRRK